MHLPESVITELLLKSFRPHDRDDRLQLSDVMLDAGRTREADLLRRLDVPVWVDGGVINPSVVHYFTNIYRTWPTDYRIYAVRSEDRKSLCELREDMTELPARLAKRMGYYQPRRDFKRRGFVMGQFLGPHVMTHKNVHEAIGCALADTWILLLKNGLVK